MQFEITIAFNAWIAQRFAEKQEICNFLINHERKGKCIEKLCEQIRIAELSNIRKVFDQRRYKQLIEAVAQMFCAAALEQASQEAMSAAERQRRMSEANHLKECETMLHEIERENDNQVKVFINQGDSNG